MTGDEPPAEDLASVRGLLRGYDRARAGAAELRPVVWSRSRPCVWWSWWLPRPTLLTRFYLSRHIERSLGALEREYHAREALGKLNDAERGDRELCAAYHRSLRTPRQLVAVLAYVVAALVVAQILVVKSEYFEDLVSRIVWTEENAVRDSEEDRAREALRLVAKTFSGSPATSVDVVDRTMGMTGTAVVVLFAAVIFVAYLSTRMLVPAFRLKRQLLCLADQTGWGVRDTAAGWFVNKSVGAYARERAVFQKAGARPPAEWPIDLIILAAPPVLLVSIAVGYVRFAEGYAYPLALSVWFFAAFALRVGWLYSCNRRRHTAPEPGADDGSDGFGRIPPFVARGADGSRVEGRTVLGVAAWPVLVVILAPFLDNVAPWLSGLGTEVISLTFDLVLAALPWLVIGIWHWLTVTTGRIEEAFRRDPSPRAPRRVWVSMLLFASVVLSPVAVTRDLRRLGELLEDPSRRTRLRRLAGLSVVVPVLVLSFWASLGVLLSDPDGPASGLLYPVFAVTGTLMVFAYGAILGAVQWAQNLLLPTCATLTPFGRCDEG
ncbi:hypothetical protein O7606_00070 [Micromonospora sp. WMMD882]|uniref:hypothetical protein n=1 Tax=Micromonospora sp. WMMD882 TaxID=3015151 RepID=UPI00248B9486|nr:hypothetical protein [Micromonospora sp. WMMD882]WBB79849.1 hypothetical protein O7606_00070 [Micromonospora sp. WMMD882]